jgi:predicted TIM-barrel fold metal-dependent hydrolase
VRAYRDGTDLSPNAQPQAAAARRAPARGPTRRAILALAALGAAAGLPGGSSAAGPSGAEDKFDPAPRRIDVHHHFFPPAWLDVMRQRGAAPSPAQRDWSAAQVLEHMDKSGVATAIASLSPWGVAFADVAQLRQTARACNDFAAQMSRDHPGRFGLFAAMPLPDVDATLKEIAHALDTLKADGIGLMTSYGGKWPGDPDFRPVLEELDRRKAVVYFHPTTANCCGNLLPGVSPAQMEWPFDTTRAAASLLYSGCLARYSNIRFIFSHAGGAIPALAGRLAAMSRGRKDLAAIAPQGVVAELAKLHYDTANAYFAPTMAALLKFVPVSQIVFGTDYPYFSLEDNVAGVGAIPLTAPDRQAINRGNAARLMPRYAG